MPVFVPRIQLSFKEHVQMGSERFMRMDSGLNSRAKDSRTYLRLYFRLPLLLFTWVKLCFVAMLQLGESLWCRSCDKLTVHEVRYMSEPPFRRETTGV